jgi:hypothetical protein
MARVLQDRCRRLSTLRQDFSSYLALEVLALSYLIKVERSRSQLESPLLTLRLLQDDQSNASVGATKYREPSTDYLENLPQHHDLKISIQDKSVSLSRDSGAETDFTWEHAQDLLRLK